MKKVTDVVIENTVQEEPVKKKTVVKKTTEKKSVERKSTDTSTAEKKTVARKKKAITEEVYVQFSNSEVAATNIVEKVKAAYVAEGHTLDTIEKLRVYIKPEENMIYYVVNDDYASGIDLI